jgi:hypothetical protein
MQHALLMRRRQARAQFLRGLDGLVDGAPDTAQQPPKSSSANSMEM